MEEKEIKENEEIEGKIWEKREQMPYKLKTAQIIIRVYPDIRDKLRDKSRSDGITLQKVFEIFIDSYLKNNTTVMERVNRLIEKKKQKKKGVAKFDESEIQEILHLIEKEHSPLRYEIKTRPEGDDKKDGNKK